MHALLLTVLTIAAQPGTNFTPAAHTSEIAPVQHTADCGCSSGSSSSSEGYVSGGYAYGGDYGGGYYEGGILGSMRAKKGPMPQTCYAPRYGCYPGNDRYVHRYPAFHDSYYRRPYAYRNCFEYPWHAELHEPTSLWSYNVPLEEDVYFDGQEVPVPPLGSRTQPAPVEVHSARRAPVQQAPQQQAPQQQSRPQQSPQPLGTQTRDARVMQQGLTEALPPVVSQPAPRERGPQPTPAVRPPRLAPVVPMSAAAAELARESVETGSSVHRMSDLMEQR